MFTTNIFFNKCSHILPRSSGLFENYARNVVPRSTFHYLFGKARKTSQMTRDLDENETIKFDISEDPILEVSSYDLQNMEFCTFFSRLKTTKGCYLLLFFPGFIVSRKGLILDGSSSPIFRYPKRLFHGKVVFLPLCGTKL